MTSTATSTTSETLKTALEMGADFISKNPDTGKWTLGFESAPSRTATAAEAKKLNKASDFSKGFWTMRTK